MLRYHFLRTKLQSEQVFLQKQLLRGYQLRRFRGARYFFQKFPRVADQQVLLVLTTTPLRPQRPGQRVTARRLARDLYYNVLYAPAQQQVAVKSDPAELAAYHRYMLEHGARQQWKGGIGIFIGVFLLTLQAGLTAATGLSSSWLLRTVLSMIGGGLALAGAWGLIVGMRNTLAAVHAKKPAVAVKD